MLLVYTLLIATIVLLVFLIIRQNKTKSADISVEIINKLNEQFPQVLQNANESLVLLATQRLQAEKQQISTDLVNKKEAIEELVKRVLDEQVKNQQKLEAAEQNRIGAFSTLTQKLEEQKYLTEQLKTTTDGLKRVLSNNQNRGAFGEQIAEDLLKIAGFISGVDYFKQLTTGQSRPDFTVLLPDGVKINIDAKFPYSNLVKMSETEDQNQKDQHLKAFAQDVKEKIKQVSTRDYINPEENTVDFVILFIPNEMIFSFIYERFPEIWQEAMSKKVVLAGPFSFTAILRMVRQSYDNFHYQKNVQTIISYIKKFADEFQVYNLEFEKIGDKINSLSDQYQKVSTTRTRQLVRIIDKIKLDDQSAFPATQN